ncbi:energy transducer TonB [Pandoraea bronchicola]|uniref:Energy transducer TonB n=1 Tax=Pandoraea bronchicola TaxID=2508287 RepID=A0A5E5BXY5_9BURK|nr:energy transducer TonB [Pandoraea bronchicola]VVE90474.1 energy transducer TonB [Pandoraea bronchicola]
MSGANGTMLPLQVSPLPRWLAGSPETARSPATLQHGGLGVRNVATRWLAGRRALMLGLIAVAHAGGLAMVMHLPSDPPVVKGPAPIYATLVQDAPAQLTPPAPPTPVQPAKPTPQVSPRVTPKPTPAPVPAPTPVPSTVPASAAAPGAVAQTDASLPSQASTAPSTAPAAVVPAPPRTITHGVQYLRAPVLVYPEASRRMGEEGVVTVRVFVGADGLPREVIVRQSSGSPSLDAAGIRAAQQAVFKPYTEDGKPQAVYVIVPLRFSLDT